jgi:hypothetical protein
VTNHTNLIERLNKLANVLALVSPPDAAEIREAAQAISTLTAEVEAMRLAGNELADKAHLLTFASRDEPLNKVAKAALDAWFATLTKGEGDKLP